MTVNGKKIIADIGSTYTKFCPVVKGALGRVVRVENSARGKGAGRIAATVFCSSVNAAAARRFKRSVGGDFRELARDFRVPLTLDIRNPGTVGQDRLAGAYAAYAAAQGAVMTIDIGTAITANFVDRDGVFRGGFIGVGPAALMHALHTNTASLPLGRFRSTNGKIGRDTFGAMRGAVEMQVAGLLDRYVEFGEEFFGAPVPIFVTGGAAGQFAKFLPRRAVVDDRLVLRGVYLSAIRAGLLDGDE